MTPCPAISTTRSSSDFEICSHHGSDVSDEAWPEIPNVCRCENQLAHYDWAGRPHPNLPQWCRPTIGYRAPTPFEMASDIAVNNGSGTATEDGKGLTATSLQMASDIAVNDGSVTATEDSKSLTALALQSDSELEKAIVTRPEEQAKPKDPNESTDEQHDATKGTNNDLADSKSKRKREESSGGRTYKKSKYTTSISIKFSHDQEGATRSSMEISVTTDRKI